MNGFFSVLSRLSRLPGAGFGVSEAKKGRTGRNDPPPYISLKARMLGGQAETVMRQRGLLR